MSVRVWVFVCLYTLHPRPAVCPVCEYIVEFTQATLRQPDYIPHENHSDMCTVNLSCMRYESFHVFAFMLCVLFTVWENVISSN